MQTILLQPKLNRNRTGLEAVDSEAADLAVGDLAVEDSEAGELVVVELAAVKAQESRPNKLKKWLQSVAKRRIIRASLSDEYFFELNSCGLLGSILGSGPVIFSPWGAFLMTTAAPTYSGVSDRRRAYAMHRSESPSGTFHAPLQPLSIAGDAQAAADGDPGVAGGGLVAAGGHVGTTGDPLEVTGEGMNAAGESLASAGETFAVRGENKAATGGTLVPTGETLVATGEGLCAIGEAFSVAGQAFVATGELNADDFWPPAISVLRDATDFVPAIDRWANSGHSFLIPINLGGSNYACYDHRIVHFDRPGHHCSLDGRQCGPDSGRRHRVAADRRLLVGRFHRGRQRFASGH